MLGLTVLQLKRLRKNIYLCAPLLPSAERKCCLSATYGPTKEAAEKHCYFFHFCCRDVFRGACCLCFLLFSYFVSALEQLCNTLRLADHTAGSNFLMRTKLQAAAAN